MGSDDLFKKRRKERKERKYEMLTPRANSFLIVTEGSRKGRLMPPFPAKCSSCKRGCTLTVIFNCSSIMLCTFLSHDLTLFSLSHH